MLVPCQWQLECQQDCEPEGVICFQHLLPTNIISLKSTIEIVFFYQFQLDNPSSRSKRPLLPLYYMIFLQTQIFLQVTCGSKGGCRTLWRSNISVDPCHMEQVGDDVHLVLEWLGHSRSSSYITGIGWSIHDSWQLQLLAQFFLLQVGSTSGAEQDHCFCLFRSNHIIFRNFCKHKNCENVFRS